MTKHIICVLDQDPLTTILDPDLDLHICTYVDSSNCYHIIVPEVVLFVQCWFLAAIVHCHTNDRGGRCDHHHIFHACTRIVIRISVVDPDVPVPV